MKARLCELFKNEADYEVRGETFLGKSLKNKKYKSLFNYFFNIRWLVVFIRNYN